MMMAAIAAAALIGPAATWADGGAETVYDLAQAGDRIKTIGRTVTDENGIYVSWSNSGIAFSGEFEGEVKLEAKGFTSYYAYHNIVVVVDGDYDLASRYAIYKGQRTYTVATVGKGYHTIEIFKQNEARWGYLVFQKLHLNGTLGERPADKDMQIEFIGDSITCGYGIHPSGGKFEYPVVDGRQIEEEDSYFSYAGLVSRKLNADASFISLGGWGIVQGGDLREENVPRIYDQICGVAEGPCLGKWDFAGNQVDLVISNQGTNDWTLWSQGGTEEIRKGTIAFCKKLRVCYPEAEIVWCYGVMHADLDTLLREAVESVGDPKLHYLTLPGNTSGGNQHPDYWGHDAAANALLEYLKTLGIS